MASILTTIKKKLNISEEDTSFDEDIITDINSVLMILNQLNIGPTECLSITDSSTEWITLLGDRKDLEGVKTYIYLKVRLMFDPPTNSFLLASIDRQITELEWRLNSIAEPPIIDTTTTTTV
jgi:hypothetical protein